MTGPIKRLRAEEGFGLVELMISLVVLNVGILAIVAAFNAGSLALLRASETSIASTLADKQAELYRAITYNAISLNTTVVSPIDATYTGDTVAYPGPGTRVTGACTSPVANSCLPTRVVNGSSVPPSPDGRSYRIDTYIVRYIPVASPPGTAGREVKRVTVVVRRSSPLKTLARVTANFDASTG
jgi:Tfp pilus assembly protein PilV